MTRAEAAADLGGSAHRYASYNADAGAQDCSENHGVALSEGLLGNPSGGQLLWRHLMLRSNDFLSALTASDPLGNRPDASPMMHY